MTRIDTKIILFESNPAFAQPLQKQELQILLFFLLLPKLLEQPTAGIVQLGRLCKESPAYILQAAGQRPTNIPSYLDTINGKCGMPMVLTEFFPFLHDHQSLSTEACLHQS